MVTHTKDYQFACPLCDRRFTRKVVRDMHVKDHNGYRKHKCAYCDQTFIRSEGLRNHIGVHTGERPFPCGLCPMQFRYSYASSNHRRSVHMIDGQYRCERCGYAVATFPVFKVHMLGCSNGSATNEGR